MVVRIAHRGEPRGQRENTLPAISAAAAAGADVVEIDLRLTADGELVVLHDETLERLWGDPRSVADIDLAEVSRWHRSGGTWSIPTLDEALDLLVELDTMFMLDFTTVAVALATADAVRRRGMVDRVLYAGATPALVAVREIQPTAEIALSWQRSEPPPPALWKRIRPRYFNPQWQLLDAAAVDAVHAGGDLVSTWTVDDAADMTKLIAMGVDAIITNEIATLVELTGATGGSAAAASR